MLLCIQALGVLYVTLQLLSLLCVQIADCYKYMSWLSGIWLGETYVSGPKSEGAKERSGVFIPLGHFLPSCRLAGAMFLYPRPQLLSRDMSYS